MKRKSKKYRCLLYRNILIEQNGGCSAPYDKLRVIAFLPDIESFFQSVGKARSYIDANYQEIAKYTYSINQGRIVMLEFKMKRRTSYIDGEKIAIKSEFSSAAMGFIIHINGEKFFNKGTDKKGKWDNIQNDWIEIARELAEDRCSKEWLYKKQREGETEKERKVSEKAVKLRIKTAYEFRELQKRQDRYFDRRRQGRGD